MSYYPMKFNERSKELLEPIAEEFCDRADLAALEALGEPGAAALSIALMKAFLVGEHFAKTEVAAALIEGRSIPTQVETVAVELEQADFWPSEYGDAT